MTHPEESSIDRYTRAKWHEEAERAERSRRRAGVLYFGMAGLALAMFVLRVLDLGRVEPRMWVGLGVAVLFAFFGRRARRWRYPPFPEPR